MDIKLENHFELEDYIKLRSLAGWADLDLDDIKNLIVNSDYMVAAKTSDRVLGIGRCISDLTHIFLLCDILVSPEYQGMGIGKMMVNHLIQTIKNDNKGKNIRIYIMSLKGKEGFYKSLGFSEEAATGLSIILSGDEE